MHLKNFFNQKSLFISLPIIALIFYSTFQYKELKNMEVENIAFKDTISVYKEKNISLLEVLDQTKTDKSILFEEVLKEKEMNFSFKNVELELNNSKLKVNQLQSITEDLNNKLKATKNDNLELYQLNQQILKHAEQVLKSQNESQRISEKILVENSNLLNRIEKDKGSVLKFSGLKISAYFLNSTNKQIYSLNSNDINFLSVKFKIHSNPFFVSSYLDFYIQVIDPNGKIILENKLVENNETKLSYTNLSRVYYNNLDLNVSQNIFIKNTKPGIHTVNIIFKENTILTDKLILK